MPTSRKKAPHVQDLPHRPGVYRMLDAEGKALYVGKARDLHKRVSSYFRGKLPPRLSAMVRQIQHVEVTVTETENEALLLENNLIKSLQPRYNVLLRDDKSYPYLHITGHTFPRLCFYRGQRRGAGRYFGPYPSVTAVREVLGMLQKTFLLRQCEDGFFRNRSRPCLQYQIKRCSAPCVGLIDEKKYKEDVQQCIRLLEGGDHDLVDDLTHAMEASSAAQAYEDAARIRDRVARLRQLQERQYISNAAGDADALAIAITDDTACVAINTLRGGLSFGSRAFFPKHAAKEKTENILAAFITQYYLDKPMPNRIYIDRKIPDQKLIGEVFSRQEKKKITLQSTTRGAAKAWIKLAKDNAVEALRRRIGAKAGTQQRIEALQKALSLDHLPERIECFDVSHTMGEAAMASCVVFGPQGPIKSDYRRFIIEDIKSGDDYAALQQAVRRHYEKRKTNGSALPDLLLIDGGKGQLSRVHEIIEELQITDVVLVAVAKGVSRKPGMEQLFMLHSRQPLRLQPDAKALHLIQEIRDEAHRFAITGHRQRRGKKYFHSALEDIPGIGAKRRQALLKHVGGMKELKRASMEQLARAPGISLALAEKIYRVLHDQSNP